MARFWSVLVLIVATTCEASLASATAPSDLLLVLDASGSMWGQVAGENKIVIARRAVKDLAGKIPPETRVGLLAYGHRREGDCEDIESVIPLGPLDVEHLGATVDALNAKGKTPITEALRQAVDVVKGRDTSATVVLVSDGLETCGGDPCAAVRAAKESGVKFVLHVIGFDLGEADVSQLECTAQAGGGLFFDARNARELGEALDDVLEAPSADVPAARLSVRAIAGDALLDGLVHVRRAGETEIVAKGRTYTHEETNPRLFPLEPGLYDVEVKAVRLKGDTEQRFTGVEVQSTGPTELVADFSSGELAVGVTRNGALSDATINIHRTGTQERVAGGRSYRGEKTNPRVNQLTPGTYDVRIGSVEIADKPTVERTGLEVRPGERTDITHDFPSGTLKIGATQGDVLIDAVVAIRKPDTNKQVAGGRTYVTEKTNPKVFELTPGTYSVRVAPMKIAGSPEEVFEITVAAGETADRVVPFE